MRKAVPALLLLAAACYAGPSRYYQSPAAPSPAPKAPEPAPDSASRPPPAPDAASRPPPGPTGSPKMIAKSEALSAATGYARSHGFAVGRVKHVHLDGAGRWHVDLVGEKPKEKANLLVDGWTGQILKATMKEED